MTAKDSLITQTQALLWERGYIGTSPKAIQERALVGQGSMYHHFKDKADLALAAIERSSEEMQREVNDILSADGTAIERITALLRRERDVLRGCRIGRLAQDPEVFASSVLRKPVNDTFDMLKRRLSEVLELGIARKELHGDLNVADTATLICAVAQGAYVLARAANSEIPFEHAINGLLLMLDEFAI
ncbi:TetR/AcrR family transcriptional regulator [Burkholderia sp. Ac-20353]|uniref:TetR/AcrR family transcriptional regulator n=1 Tax=Burkholderia sp. Ac-20353 TaxID=2703894 RepID=UPI00197C1B97|nr:TetR/AcrR family transcriptional regulator [Burkholderia sp. Ac-20353]MBN3787995.1 TetR/AcrR family transcriptional regulator [Burkholderia sp. Ac-20353]